MDSKRKKIYIGIIVACILISAITLLWGRGGSGPVVSTDFTPSNPTSTGNSNVVIRPSADGVYPAPAVFPANNTLDLSILNSSTFKSLQADPPVTLGPTDLNRENPFSGY